MRLYTLREIGTMHDKRRHFVLKLCCIALMLANTGGLATSQTTSKGRAMTQQDLLTRQILRETVLSPDGKWAAVVVERQRTVGESYERGYLRGLERSDVWLASTDGKRMFDVTHGEAVHAGYWNPVWSPDSKRLAMISTRGGDNIRAYIYDLNTQHLRACITDGLDLGTRIELANTQLSTMVWLNPNQLLLGVLPRGIRPIPFDETERTSRIAAKAIADVKRGRGVTSSILDTEPVERSAAQQKSVALSLVDVVTNKARVLARMPLVETRLTQRVVSISPDRAYAAILLTDYPNRVPPDRPPTGDDLSPLRLGVAALEKTNETVVWVANVRPVTFGLTQTPTSIRWAPKGSKFAFIGMSNKDRLPGVFTVIADEKQPKAVSALKYDESAPDAQFLTAEDIQWAANGELLVYGYAGTSTSLRAEVSQKNVRGFGRDNNKETAKRDWWIISSPNSYHNLTSELAQPPGVLFKTHNANVMVGAGGGRIWTIDTDSRTVKALSVGDSSPASLVWPRPADVHRPVDQLVLSYARDAGSDLFRVDVSAGTRVSVKLGTMPPGAVFTGYSPSSQLIAYETDVNEVRVIGEDTKEPVTLVSVNRHLDAIAKPQYRTVQYQTVDGQKFSAALLLPYGYTAGQRYPLIVYVYGGSLAPTGNWANPYKVISRGLLDPLILAGRGYAVLIPSIPLESMAKPSDPMLDLDRGVKPAIEKVVELGIADSERIGLFGHSYGGYTVYGLVTQTQRFKAAVAYAGITDLLSLYGSLDPRYRFNDVINPIWGPYFLESQQTRMGVPPWKDLDRYLRNSPYVHADKVTTPLLMIHGDLDGVPLSQAEQFFIALNRQGKRAKLVRYLGEGHVVESPGNTIDMWDHILNWFDEFLQNRQHNQSAKTK
jgi:dipeptidyl aminopeptidase/acylaminoacyl peptidase